MGGRHLVVTIPGNCPAFVLVGQIVVDFLQKILLAFITDKVFPWGKVLQKILLIIREEKTAAAHDIKGAQRNAAFDAAQRNIQVDAAFLKDRGISE